MVNDKKQFLFNIEWTEVLEELPKEVKYEVYDAIIEYAKSGTISDLKPIAKGVFLFIKKEMDYNQSRYDEKVEKNRANGRKGGNPKLKKDVHKNEAEEVDSERNRTQPNATERNRTVADGSERNRTQPNATERNRTVADGSERNRTQPNATLYDNDNDNENDNDSTSYSITEGYSITGEKKDTTDVVSKKKEEGSNVETGDNSIVQTHTESRPTTRNRARALDTSFVDEDYRELFDRWLQYKADRGERYKSDMSLRACYSRLRKLSNNNAMIAEQIVEQSIASNYAGLFELKQVAQNTANGGTTGENIGGFDPNSRDSEQRRRHSVIAVSTRVQEAFERKKVELKAKGIID